MLISNFQELLPSKIYVSSQLKNFISEISLLKEKQLHIWSQFNIVKQGRSLIDIKNSINCCDSNIKRRDHGGLLLTHLAAAYNHVNMVKWILVIKGVDLNVVDGFGQTAIDAAKVRKASTVVVWITEFQARRVILVFLLQRHYQRLVIIRKHQKDCMQIACRRINH